MDQQQVLQWQALWVEQQVKELKMALIQLDTRVPLMAQAPQIDFNQLANNTLNLYDNIKQRGQQGVLSRLLAQNMGENGQPDLNKALQAVQSNPRQAYQPALINTLSGLLKQQRAEELKAQQDAEKFKNDSAKTIAETEDKRLGNTQKGQTLLANLIATSTDATDAARKLATFGQQYGLPKDLIDSTLMDLKNLADNNQGSPEAFQTMQKSFGLLGSDKPLEYMMPNANTVANNETSAANNVRTTNATLSGQQTQKEIADANRKQSDAHFQYQQYIQKNKPIGSFVDIDGYRRVEFADGTSMRSVGEDGQPIKVQTKASGTPKLSDKALSMVGDMNVQLSTSNQNKSKIDDLIKDIEGGKLNLSAASQGGAWLMNRAGLSDENTRGIENFQTALNQAVNDLLLMAKGVQTEGDAQRAAQVIAANPPRDNKAALQTLERLATIQQNTIDVLNNNINNVYDNYGVLRPQQGLKPPSDNPPLGGMSFKVNDVAKAAKARGVSISEMERIIKSTGGTIVK
ncbi:hypothetical protein F4U02_13200 [Acinetobacter haemolyticus]|nr:hypothetical protein [Acinetobacter haemolyticus]